MNLLKNIVATDMQDVKKSARDAILFAFGLFALKFIGNLDPNSIQANTVETLKNGLWEGANAVYSAWIALLMPMLMRMVRTGNTDSL